MPNNPLFSLVNDNKPCSRSDDSDLPASEKRDFGPSMPVSYVSKFDKAMRVYTSHLSEKAVKKALKEATCQEETAPPSSAMQVLKYQGLSPSLIKAIHKIPLEYKPSHLELSASVHSEMGNSIHNSSSVARRSVDLYGVRVFKACAIMHEMLRGVDVETGGLEEGVKEDLEWWIEVLRHDLSLGGGERGYGTLLGFYITYLKYLLASLCPVAGACNFLSAHQNLSLSNHAFREALLASITSFLSSSAGAKITALKLVVADALGFPAAHESLLGMMRKEGACEMVVEERERVFEMRREEVVGFLDRCKGLGLGLDLDPGLHLYLKQEGSVVDVERLEAMVGKLRV
ncbi:hypothetical protein BKA65DRAFT_481334 [Rhexocercosporidium sp. MPI-PUGE-AT-0058]|nr:hypothetical protein BKA65DRAFT_481334 [Rhexocercosporidium sp. MPI-PUGE-AT-0058]